VICDFHFDFSTFASNYSIKMTDSNGNGNTPHNDTVIQTAPTDINALIVKLPTFWANNPRTWFIQAEAQFSLGKITADVSKYNYVVATLPQDIAETVADILENPPDADLYRNLKETLIDRHSLSLESRIKRLTSDEEIGDKKPSDFYRTLKRIAGDSGTVGGELLKKLWISKLPQAVGVALIPQKDDDVTKLTKLADQVWEAIKTANISAVSASSHPGNDDLRGEISELRAMIEKLSFDRSRSRFRSRSRSYSRSNSRNSHSGNRNRNRSRSSRYNPKGKYCYYHFKFGNKANRPCDKPCSFANDFPSANNSSNHSNHPN